MRLRCSRLAALAAVFCTAFAVAQQQQAGVLHRLPSAAASLSAAEKADLAAAMKGYAGPAYERYEVTIPVRDGVLLHTTVVRPVGSETAGEPLPLLMKRTPYGIDEDDEFRPPTDMRELATSGYIFVFQDIRGRYRSGGTFVMNRPLVAHLMAADVDESTDAYDTVAWLVAHVPNNSGRVGVFGISYPGFLAMMAGLDHHPAVKAISPQAPMTDVWIGDDFFHNGAFRQSYGYDYVQELESARNDATVNARGDQYDVFLKHTNFAGAAAAAGMTGLPTAQKFLTQPTYTAFWQAMAVQPHLHRPEVPTLEVGGYWDQEDMWGTQAEYAALHAGEAANARAAAPDASPERAEANTEHRVYMVLGPWFHGQWGYGAGDAIQGKFGTVTFGQRTGDYFRQHYQAPFFARYLKGLPGFDLEDTASFRTGENAWHTYPQWPPVAGYSTTAMYLRAGHTLSAARAPLVAAHSDGSAVAAAYVADPADPVPYRHRPVQSTYGKGSTWHTWLAEDQRFVTGRPDLAVFETPVLTSAATVTGDVVADLFAATTGTDADWVVKLIDVYPADVSAPATAAVGDGVGDGDGYELMVAEEILRGRYRHSRETPEPVKPGDVVEYKWSLHGVDHTFLKGHRMMVEVQSSWFPLYDRNPQTYVDNIMSAPAESYRAETISLFGSARFPSCVLLPLKLGSQLP